MSCIIIKMRQLRSRSFQSSKKEVTDMILVFSIVTSILQVVLMVLGILVCIKYLRS